MTKMPERDPGLWAAITAFLHLHGAQVYAFLMSVAVAALRVVYGGGGHRQMAIEGALCGLAALATVPLLEYLGLPSNLAVFIGACAGFVGVEKIREYADRILSRKVDE